MNKQIGFIGLGRMGKNMIVHLLEGGIDVVGYNRTKEVTDEFVQELKQEGVTAPKELGTFTPVYTVSELTSKLSTPKIILLMVKAGAAVDAVIEELLKAGVTSSDIVIDGGNSFYKDSVRRHDLLKEKGIEYIDCGTSGGLEGARFGACLMIGGNKETVMNCSWLWDALSGKNDCDGEECDHEHGHEEDDHSEHCECGEVLGGWTYFGPSGAGNYVKMVHNGVEYGMNQAIGEGFELLAKGPYQLDLPAVAANWMQGSVVRSWLVELLAVALEKDPKLDEYDGKVGGGETGQWTVDVAKELGSDIPVIQASLDARKKSQEKPTFAGKVVSALRNGYGGHKEESK